MKSPAAQELLEPLRCWIADEVGDPDARVDGLHRTSAGFSRENWVFAATWMAADGLVTARLIARRDPPGSVLDTDRAVETAVLSALSATDVPAPRLRWADLSGARLGRPAIVMDFVDGTCDGFVLAGPLAPDERVAIAHRLYDCLAEIHLLDWRGLGLGGAELPDPCHAAAEVALAHWERELRAVQLEPEPELAFIVEWLRTHLPISERTTLVHGDFKAGNVLLSGGEVAAVLDWETAHLGDPHEDLGWVTNPLRAREHRIPGYWGPEELLARWSERTGWAVDRERLRWWGVLANLKLSVIVLSGAKALIDGKLDRIHQAPVGIFRLMLDQIGA